MAQRQHRALRRAHHVQQLVVVVAAQVGPRPLVEVAERARTGDVRRVELVGVAAAAPLPHQRRPATDSRISFVTIGPAHDSQMPNTLKCIQFNLLLGIIARREMLTAPA